MVISTLAHWQISTLAYLLLVDSESFATVFQETYNLLGGGNTGVDVRLGSLRTHLLRCREVTCRELLGKLGIGSGHDVGHILQVGTLLHQFDKAFLELYPTFVLEFNKLLLPEAQIQLKSPTTLTTELRTFALMRLGVKSTTDIAALLFLSPQTIYNCRSVIRNKAINKDTFEQDVLQTS